MRKRSLNTQRDKAVQEVGFYHSRGKREFITMRFNVIFCFWFSEFWSKRDKTEMVTFSKQKGGSALCVYMFLQNLLTCFLIVCCFSH